MATRQRINALVQITFCGLRIDLSGFTATELGNYARMLVHLTQSNSEPGRFKLVIFQRNLESLIATHAVAVLYENDLLIGHMPFEGLMRMVGVYEEFLAAETEQMEVLLNLLFLEQLREQGSITNSTSSRAAANPGIRPPIDRSDPPRAARDFVSNAPPNSS